jgi:ankyrin repeat protein/TonB-like protein
LSSVPLTQAVTNGDAADVTALLANGADANERTSGGQTPLILATIFGHTHLIPLLLRAGADPQLRDNLGLNALDWAQRRGATDAVTLFSNKGTTTPTSVEPDVEAPKPPAPPSAKKNENARPVSDGEKSQRWLAGLKQRIAEQSERELPDGSNIFRAQPQRAPEPEAEPKPKPQLSREPQAHAPAKEMVEIEAAPVAEIKAAPVEKIVRIEPAPPATPKENPRPKSVRKRCPKCNAIYNSDLLAYCAHHVVALVDADEAPIISEPAKHSPVLFWMIIVITVTGSLVTGSLITAYYSNRAAQQTAASPPGPKSVQRGTPLVDPELEGKVVSLPIAECPLNGQEAIPGTVVVRVVINKNGQVTSARASGGDWLLRGAASEAAMKSTFWPEKLRARETEGTITYTFEH